jgi:predicted phosphodiesterase
LRIAIISDIHSNLEALTSTLKLIDTLSVDQTICLGDVVGYGANPNECVELVKRHCSVTLLGNHDQASIDMSRTKSFTTNARIAAEWTGEQLTPESKEFLLSLELTGRLDNMLFVHSSPYEPEEWHYILSVLDAQPALRAFDEPVCFIGHTHVPALYTESGRVGHVQKNVRTLVNVGSIGQPRDGNPELSFGLFDTEVWKYENIRGEYDIKTASDKILEAGLPRQLADRLFIGV